MKIFISAGSATLGPYTIAEIRQAIADGSIQEDSLACVEGDQTWRSLNEILPPENTPKQTVQVMQARARAKSLPKQEAPAPAFRTNSDSNKRIFTSAEHLARIRAETSYGALRSVINIVTALLIIGVVAVAGPVLVGTNPFNERQTMTTASARMLFLVPSVVTLILLIAARQGSLLLVDIADTLIYDSNRKR